MISSHKLNAFDRFFVFQSAARQGECIFISNNDQALKKCTKIHAHPLICTQGIPHEICAVEKPYGSILPPMDSRVGCTATSPAQI
jgi:hypothetical protein